MDDFNPAMRDLFLGGEDEEEQDLPDRRQPRSDRAYLRVDIRSHPDGSATAWYNTNDRNADGRPDRQTSGWDDLVVSWDERHESVEEALRRAGRSRTEPTGRVVTVHLDGARVE